MLVETTKFSINGYRKPVTLKFDGKRIEFNFPYDTSIMAEVKMMEEAKYHGYDPINPKKVWSVLDSNRNRFQISYLKNENPYWRYDREPQKLPVQMRMNSSLGREVAPYSHQQETFEFIVSRRQCILAEEMGIGKTLALIMAMEYAKETYGWEDADFWYVAPKGAIKAIEREFWIWQCKVHPVLMTYEQMVKQMKNWPAGKPAPKFVTYDEASRVKSPTSQRSQAAKALADGVRSDWGAPQSKEDCGFVVLMSGTPAPRAPDDWWMLCEIACPGFLKEGNIFKFRNALGIIVKRENTTTGGIFPQLVTWKDNDKKCAKCGQLANHPEHLNPVFSVDPKDKDKFHKFEAGVNEIARLYKRMMGLVIVKFKKDCLDLPEKQYRIIELKPNQSILRASKLILKSSPTVIEGLTRLRELSDGFQYRETICGKEACGRCGGSKKAFDYESVAEGNEPARQVEIVCPNCDENGQVNRYERTVEEIRVPKDEAIEDLLDELDDVGRIIIFAGFTASIDKNVKTCIAAGWHVIRLDARGWHLFAPDGSTVVTTTDYLGVFQDLKEQYPKVAFVAHPASGGLGLTLTASPYGVFYSNDFNGEYRSQAEDRGHRPGMDLNRGYTVIDLVHLPTDKKVRDNLMAKRNLELMSLGDLTRGLDEAEERIV